MIKLPSVRTFMDPDHHAVGEDEDIFETVRMLIREGVTGAPVVDEAGRVTGMLTEGECLKLLTKGTTEVAGTVQRRVKDYMDTSTETVSPDMDIYFVAGLFIRSGHRRFAVVENERIVAVITRKDILRAVELGLPK